MSGLVTNSHPHLFTPSVPCWIKRVITDCSCVFQLMRVMACNHRLEQKLDTCLWVQKVLIGLVLVLVVLNLQCLYLLGTAQRPS